ncbi:MAG: cytochrome c, partial [Burkholderia ambifaria]
MALISFTSFRFPGRAISVALAVLAACVALAACDMQQDDHPASPGDTADAASAAEAPEPASGWRFVRIGASAADAGASMSARVKGDRRLSGPPAAAASSASSASTLSASSAVVPSDAASAKAARR